MGRPKAIAVFASTAIVEGARMPEPDVGRWRRSASVRIRRVHTEETKTARILYMESLLSREINAVAFPAACWPNSQMLTNRRPNFERSLTDRSQLLWQSAISVHSLYFEASRASFRTSRVKIAMAHHRTKGVPDNISALCALPAIHLLIMVISAKLL